MCGFWHDYVKPKYSEKAKLCYMDTVTLIVYIKTFKQKMLKQGLILQVMSWTDHYQKGKVKKVIGRWIGCKNHDKICWIKSKNL